MRSSLAAKMLLRIWGSTMLLFVAVALISFYYSKKEVVRGIEEHSRNLAQYYAEKFEGRFGRAEAVAEMISTNLALRTFGSEDEIKRYQRAVLSANPDLYGTCAAFEPAAFAPELELFAPYYYSKAGEQVFVQLATPEYDYLNQEWYRVPRLTGRPYWTEPYLDTGGGEAIMITYSAPFEQDGAFRGLATVDIDLDDLTDQVNAVKVADSGYALIVSRSGTLVSFPDKSLILHSKLNEFSPELAARMIHGEAGFVEADDPWRNEPSWIVYYPISSTNLSIAMVYPLREVMSRFYSFEKTSLWLGALALLLLMLIVALFSRSIARPVMELADAARRIAVGDLEVRLPHIRSSDEVGELSQAFSKMVNDLQQYIEQLRRTTAERERIASELDIAYHIQQSILPSTFPAFPGIAEFDLFARSIPAREVGGDFYDFFLLPDERLGFVIGDVSGKGIPAAMFMAVCRTLLKAIALQGLAPGACLTRVNSLIIPENELSMFVTVFYGVLDPLDGRLEYANAGHCPPYLLRAAGLSALKHQPQIALGLFEGTPYSTHSGRLDPDDTLFLFTDGVTEAADRADRLYTAARLEALLTRADRSSPATLLDQVIADVQSYADGALQADDITALALLYCGGKALAATTLSLRNRIDELARAQQALDELAHTHGLPRAMADDASLAIEEVLSNVIKYAFADSAEHAIELRLELRPGPELRIEIADDGRPFDPLQAPAPAVAASLDQFTVGGLGIHLVRHVMDQVRYRRRDGRNVLTMLKRDGRSAAASQG